MMPARIRSAAAAHGIGIGAYSAALAIQLTTTRSISAAAVAIAAGAAGRAGTALWIGRALRAGTRTHQTRNLHLASIAILVAGASASLNAAGRMSLTAVALLSILQGAGSNLATLLASTSRPGQMVSYSPMVQAGSVAGAMSAGALAAFGAPLWPVHLMVLVHLLEPALIRPYLGDIAPRARIRPLIGRSFAAAALAAASYGPLWIYAALVTDTLGPAYVGAAQAMYAAGALGADPVDRLLAKRSRTYRESGWAVTVALAAAGAATWVVSGHVEGMLLGRCAAGTLMFLSQGRLMREGAENPDGGVTRAAATSAGLGVGSAFGAIGAGWLAGRYGAGSMGLYLALITLTLAPAGAAAGRLGGMRQGRSST